MKKHLSIVLLIIFGNALTFAVCAPLIGLIRIWWIMAVILAGYTALSVISARHFKRKFGFGYRKYWLLAALPSIAVSAALALSVFGADSTPWVLSASAMMFGGLYLLFFGGSLLVVWGREEFG